MDTIAELHLNIFEGQIVRQTLRARIYPSFPENFNPFPAYFCSVMVTDNHTGVTPASVCSGVRCRAAKLNYFLSP